MAYLFTDIQSQNECTFWIRRSSGRLCTDLIPSNTTYWSSIVDRIPGQQGIKSLDLPNQEVIATDALTLEQYHKICYWDLSRHRHLYCSTSATVNLNTIITWASGDRLEDPVEIALLLDADVNLGDWRTPERVSREVMEDGWTRYYDFILAAW
jgi:hypothetical protein